MMKLRAVIRTCIQMNVISTENRNSSRSATSSLTKETWLRESRLRDSPAYGTPRYLGKVLVCFPPMAVDGSS